MWFFIGICSAPVFAGSKARGSQLEVGLEAPVEIVCAVVPKDSGSGCLWGPQGGRGVCGGIVLQSVEEVRDEQL